MVGQKDLAPELTELTRRGSIEFSADALWFAQTEQQDKNFK